MVLPVPPESESAVMPEIDLEPRGLFCAAPTPLTRDYRPDHAAFVAFARRVLAEGCDGVSLLGTTGEANSLTLGDRKALLEATVAAGIAPARLMPGTGMPALADTVDLTRHALSLGVTAMLMLPPFYYKSVSEEGLYAAYSEVIERVGDPRLRIVLYHFPQVATVAIPHGLIGRLRERYPSIVTGIKDSSGDLANLTTMVERFPGFAVMTGADPLVLPLMRAGGAGAITACANVAAADLAFILRHHADPAAVTAVAAAQARLLHVNERCTRYAQLASTKALVADATGDETWVRVCPPLTALTEAERAEIRPQLSSSLSQ